MTLSCPVCSSRKFRDINGRTHALCGKCGAYERTRLMWLIVERLMPKANNWDVLHFAPERGLSERLQAAAGGSYSAFDFNPEGYKLVNSEVRQFDLCTDAASLPSESADLIVHSHVLEHLPCALHPVLQQLNRALRPGGFQVFSVPVGGAYYECNLDPNLPAAERTARFGQDDHMRRFGHRDVRAMFSQIFGQDVHFSRTTTIPRSELISSAIPESVLDGLNSHSVLVWQKPPRAVREA